MKGLHQIRNKISIIYRQLITWKKNFFDIPSGNAGKKMLDEVKRLLMIFNNEARLQSVSLHALQIFLPLILQKPAKKSKRADHVRYLSKRLLWWKEGEFDKLFDEAAEIQRRLHESERKDISALKGFTRLMLEGKTKQAVKLIDMNSGIVGVHTLTGEIKAALEAKHPDGKCRTTTGDEPIRVEEVIFEEITSEAIIKAASSTSGSGGPTKIPADTWKRILCSRGVKYASGASTHQ